MTLTGEDTLHIRLAEPTYFWKTPGAFPWPEDWPGEAPKVFLPRLLLSTGQVMFPDDWTGEELAQQLDGIELMLPEDKSEASSQQMQLAHWLTAEPPGALLGDMEISTDGYARARELQERRVLAHARQSAVGATIINAIRSGKVPTFARPLKGIGGFAPIQAERYWAIQIYWPSFTVGRFFDPGSGPVARLRDQYVYVDAVAATKFLAGLANSQQRDSAVTVLNTGGGAERKAGRRPRAPSPEQRAIAAFLEAKHSGQRPNMSDAEIAKAVDRFVEGLIRAEPTRAEDFPINKMLSITVKRFFKKVGL